MLSAIETGELLEDLCLRLGFCLLPAAHAHLMRETPGDAASFAEVVSKPKDWISRWSTSASIGPYTTSWLPHSPAATTMASNAPPRPVNAAAVIGAQGHNVAQAMHMSSRARSRSPAVLARELGVVLGLNAILSVSCVGPAATPGGWEYRVIDTHEYYGFGAAEDMQRAFVEGELMQHLSVAKNRWGAEGWDFVPERGELSENRLLLRRNSSNPAAFEVQFVMQQELGQGPVESVQGRINELVRDGWTLERCNPVCLEFHRAR